MACVWQRGRPSFFSEVPEHERGCLGDKQKCVIIMEAADGHLGTRNSTKYFTTLTSQKLAQLAPLVSPFFFSQVRKLELGEIKQLT